MCVSVCIVNGGKQQQKNTAVQFNSLSDFILPPQHASHCPPALHGDKWLCHSLVSVEGGPFVVNVSACALAGRWVFGGCEILSLRNSSLASTPGQQQHHRLLIQKKRNKTDAQSAKLEIRKDTRKTKTTTTKSQKFMLQTSCRGPDRCGHATFSLSDTVPLLLHLPASFWSLQSIHCLSHIVP